MPRRFLFLSSLIFSIWLAACKPIVTPQTPTSLPTPSSTVVPEAVTLETQPEFSLDEKTPVIFDDDGSPDGTTALFYLLSHPRVNMLAVNITYGEAHPAIYIQHVGRVLDQLQRSDILLGFGPDSPLAGENAFPESVRENSGNFWGIPIPNQSKTYPVQPAAELIVSVLNSSAEPVTMFISGPCTNLAMALRLDPGISEKIESVAIMGGAVYVPGNIHDFFPDSANVVAEWNIFADPLAAKEVFESGIPLFLVPLDATNQVQVKRQDVISWSEGGAAADYASEFYRKMFDEWGWKEAAVWDVMTAAIMMNTELCEFTDLALQVITQPGDSNGQTAVVDENKLNVSVCLEPDAESIRQEFFTIFSGHEGD